MIFKRITFAALSLFFVNNGLQASDAQTNVEEGNKDVKAFLDCLNQHYSSINQEDRLAYSFAPWQSEAYNLFTYNLFIEEVGQVIYAYSINQNHHLTFTRMLIDEDRKYIANCVYSTYNFFPVRIFIVPGFSCYVFNKAHLDELLSLGAKVDDLNLLPIVNSLKYVSGLYEKFLSAKKS